MKPVDCHCHLDFEHFNEDRNEVIETCRSQLEFVVSAGSNPETNRSALELQNNYPETVVANMGLHPVYTDYFPKLEEVKKQIRENDPAAIGEIGLDHHHVKDQVERERQEEVFRELLDLAEELDKPVVVHSRDAEQKAVDILEEYDFPGVMLHCFNGSPELAERASRNGMMIGVTTQVLYSDLVQEIVAIIDSENLLLETDSPFLYPEGRNEPVHVTESVEKIADIKEIEKQKVVEKTTKNARNFFR